MEAENNEELEEIHRKMRNLKGLATDIYEHVEEDNNLLAGLGDSMDKVKNEGYITLSPANGEIISNYLKIGNTALANAIKLSDKFGFNPAARTKIEMPNKKENDKGLSDLL